MTFYLYDFNDYYGDIVLTTADYETEIRVDIMDTWDENTESWNEEQGREKVEKAVSEAFPGSTIEWYYI